MSSRFRGQTNLAVNGKVRVQSQGVWLQNDSNSIIHALRQLDLTSQYSTARLCCIELNK